MTNFLDAIQDLQNAYTDGLSAMDQASEQATAQLEPSHRIKVNVKAQAKVEGHDYLLEAGLEFLADLNSIINAQASDIASLLGGLGVDLSEEESSQVVEQLGQPRTVAKLDKFKQKELKLSSDEGEIKEGVNEKATMLIKLKDKKLHFSFESVFALPKLQAKTTVYLAIPSQEKMEKNVVLGIEDLDKTCEFSWTEKDKDGLKIEGSLLVKEEK